MESELERGPDRMPVDQLEANVVVQSECHGHLDGHGSGGDKKKM